MSALSNKEFSVKTSSQSCRLCSAKTTQKFEGKILNKYDVGYFECQSCKSLQTEPAYWLGEAYASNLSSLDTGAVQRNWHNFYAIYLLCKIFKLNNVLDLGGGDGLLCRSLRDYEINCFVQDQYATPTYAQGFTTPNFEVADLVLGFEVWEHLLNPSVDLDRFFEKRPKTLLITTTPYSNQDAKWWYLAPESGQHIFFYSINALEYIANKYGYDLHRVDNFLLFIRKDCESKTKIYLFRKSLQGKLNRFLKYKIMRKPTPGVWKDYLQQKELLEQNTREQP